MSTSERIAVIFPRRRYRTGDPPLGPACVAAALREAGRQVTLIDMTFDRSFESLKRRLLDIKPRWTGIYADTLSSDDAISAAKIAKGTGSFTVAGGPHTTVRPGELLAHFDAVVTGEGETAAVELAEKGPEQFKGRVIQGKPSDLNRSPRPALDLLPMREYISRWTYLDSIRPGLRGTNLIASRGCPFDCSYCQPTLKKLFGPKVRHRTPDDVISEMLYLKEKYALDGVFFHDDTLTADRDWCLEFSDRLARTGSGLLWGCNSRADRLDRDLILKMRAAGLSAVHLGIESASNRILNTVYKKNLRVDDIEKAVLLADSCGVHVMGFFMLGAPSETYEEMDETVALALRLPLSEATFNIATPLPGTSLWDTVRGMEKEGYSLSPETSKFDYYRGGAMLHGGISGFGLRKKQLWSLARFYTRPQQLRYILNHLASKDGIKRLAGKLSRFIA